MAEKKVIELDIETNLDLTITGLKKAQREVAELTEKFGATSKEATEAAKRAAELKDKIGDAKALTDAFNPDAKFNALSASIGGVLNGFQAYEGALGLIGVESEQVQATLLKVQSAMALSQGLQGIGEAKDSFIQLGAVVNNFGSKAVGAFNSMTNASKAFLVSGIGVLIAALGTVVAYWDDISKAIGLTTKEQEKYAQKQKRINEQSKEMRENVSKESGEFALLISRLKTTNAGSKERNELIKQINGQYGTTLKNIKDERDFQEQLNKELANYLEYQRAKFQLQKNEEKIQKNLENQDKLNKQLLEDEERLLLLRTKLAEFEKKGNDFAVGKLEGSIRRQLLTIEATKKEIEDANKRFESYGKAANDAALKVNELTNSGSKYVDNNKAVVASTEDTAKEIDLTQEELYQLEQQRLAELNKAELDSLKTIEDAKKANQDMLLTETDLAIQKENEAYQIKIDNAIKFGQDTEALEIEHLNNINNINLTAQEKQYAIDKEAKDKQIALDKETAAKKLEIEKALLEQKTAIQQQGLDTALQGIGIIKSIFEKSKGVQKAAVIAESAIGIAKMIIANKLANVGALATPQAIATSGASAVPVIAGNNISTTFGIAANVAATAKALSALGGGSAPSGSVGGGSGGGGGSTFTPSFNVVGNSGINQLASLNQQPIKAYVTAGDVSSALSLERNTLQKSTF